MEKQLESNYMLQVSDEIGLVKDNPRLLIIVSHSFVEMIVKTLCDYYIPDVKLVNHNQRLEKLRKEKVLDEFQFKLYNWFRDLRNQAAHTPVFRLEASNFAELSGMVNKDLLEVKSFHLFSIKLIAELWNKHLDILVPVYWE
ncbi:hypothetical protein [Vibrio splendidus]|uniref:hypothetical protein n=1 Tax=Vibrio splendidus TaxID=29497 RepID=UPI002468E0C1|nr:hypothetical protein [Vibrio splendidus]MDH5898178.1 hypothetical protein [Vibrio splendidus]